jgi:hypothetical protein
VSTPDWQDVGSADELARRPLGDVTVGRTRLAITDADSLVPQIAAGEPGCGIAYHDNRGGPWQTYLTRIDATGTPLGETAVSTGEYEASFPRALWAAGVWVVTWNEHVDVDDDRILAVRIGADGAVIGAPIEVVHDPRAGYGAIAANPAGDIAMVWQDASASVELGFARIVCRD